MLIMLARFAVVGLSGVGVNMIVYLLLLALGCHYLVAAFCSFIVAVTNNFIWNMLWTFRERSSRDKLKRKYIIFLSISVFNLGVNLMVLQYLVGVLMAGETVGQLLAIAVVSVLNFSMNYLITFPEETQAPEKRRGNCEAGRHANLQREG